MTRLLTSTTIFTLMFFMAFAGLLVAPANVSADHGPVEVSHEIASCGETTFTASATSGTDNMYLVVDTENEEAESIHVPNDGTEVSLTVGPFTEDTTIYWRVFGGGERNYDDPHWTGFDDDQAQLNLDIVDHADNDRGGSYAWTTEGTDDPNPFTTWYSFEVEGCPEPTPGCELTSLTVVSDSETQDGDGDATELTPPHHTAWTADLEGKHPADGSLWIWETDGVNSPTDDEIVTFTREFEWTGDSVFDATLYLASDNSHEVHLNGSLVGGDTSENNHAVNTDDVYDVTSFIQEGMNTLEVEVKNWEQSGGTEDSNPAGLLYHLDINGEDCPEKKVDNDDRITNRNSAFVKNIVHSSANTGGNYAGGADAGNGGEGGDIDNDGDDDVKDSTTGNGGNGGNAGAGSGGFIDTGNATANAEAVTIANSNMTRINRCACGESDDGDTKVRNRNRAAVFNFVGADADSGDNKAIGADAGNGGDAGNIDNDGDGEDVENSHTGNGGHGGDALEGSGGTIFTGNSFSDARSFNLLNRNVTRIVR